YGIVTHEPLTPEDSFGHSLGFDTADRVFLRQRLLRRRDDRGGNLRLGGNNGEGKRFGSSGHRFGRRGFRLHRRVGYRDSAFRREDRKSTRLNSSHVKISYAVFCLKKKRKP